jgi:geranylgeranyl diphosphate synthase type II
MDLSEQKRIFDNFLVEKTNQYFPLPSKLNEAIHYSLLGEGKRIRPLLCLGFSQVFNGNQAEALRLAVAVEMIHAYSLIHDDLPAMDNDDMRRGVPTNHKVYGEANAILAGDSLLTMAPEFLLKELSLLKSEPLKIIELVTKLLEASGHQGMVMGQALDMEYESKDLSALDKKEIERTLTNIHKLKTGSIITWSCLAGLYSHPDQEFIARNACHVQSIGQRIGLLFQIVDDILDETSTLQELGKTPGKDHKSAKLTYTNLHGVSDATIIAKHLILEIGEDLAGLQGSSNWKIISEIIDSLGKKLPA